MIGEIKVVTSEGFKYYDGHVPRPVYIIKTEFTEFLANTMSEVFSLYKQSSDGSKVLYANMHSRRTQD